jgi:hypothetical protein
MPRGLDLVDRLIAGFNARDWAIWEDILCDDAELIVSLGLGEELYESPARIRKWFDSLPRLWAEFHVELAVLIEDGEETVLSELSTWGRGTR